MTKQTKKRRKPNKARQLPPPPVERPYIPVIGDNVMIVESPVNYAVGKTGIVDGSHEEGWAVRIKTRRVNAQDYGTLERDESDNVVFCSKLKPYTPPNEKR